MAKLGGRSLRVSSAQGDNVDGLALGGEADGDDGWQAGGSVLPERRGVFHSGAASANGDGAAAF